MNQEDLKDLQGGVKTTMDSTNERLQTLLKSLNIEQNAEKEKRDYLQNEIQKHMWAVSGKVIILSVIFLLGYGWQKYLMKSISHIIR